MCDGNSCDHSYPIDLRITRNNRLASLLVPIVLEGARASTLASRICKSFVRLSHPVGVPVKITVDVKRNVAVSNASVLHRAGCLCRRRCRLCSCVVRTERIFKSPMTAWRGYMCKYVGTLRQGMYVCLFLQSAEWIEESGRGGGRQHLRGEADSTTGGALP